MLRALLYLLAGPRARGGRAPRAFRPALEPLGDRVAPSAGAPAPEPPAAGVAAGVADFAPPTVPRPPKKHVRLLGDADAVVVRVRADAVLTVSPSAVPNTFVVSVAQPVLAGDLRVVNRTPLTLTVKVQCGTTTDTFQLVENNTLNFRPPAGVEFCTVTISRASAA